MTQSKDKLIIHHAIPRLLGLNEVPDLSKVSMVPVCDEHTTETGFLLTLGWDLVNCEKCKKFISYQTRPV